MSESNISNDNQYYVSLEHAIEEEMITSFPSHQSEQHQFPCHNPEITKQMKWSELQVGIKLGEGAYSTVHKVNNDGLTHAVKALKPKLMDHQDVFETAAIDLAVEANTLAMLDHENIINLHGACSSGPIKAYSEFQKGYFVVLDLLQDTLTDRLNKAKQKTSKMMRPILGMETQDKFLSVALDIAKGMEYLHQKNIVLRDLKPDNVGFNQDGTTKLFDLGFARELSTLLEGDIAGSLRYMAPEVALRQGSFLESDVYSFGVLLWEMCTLEKPYKKYNSKEKLIDNVFVQGKRPSLSKIQSISIRDLIESCWDQDPSKRPNFSRIVKVLRIETALSAKSGVATGGLKRNKALSEGSGLRMLKTPSLTKMLGYKNKTSLQTDELSATRAPRHVDLVQISAMNTAA